MDQVAAIIVSERKVLVGRVKPELSGAYGGAQYVFPGGNIEEGEVGEKAVIRIAKEGTGLDVKVLDRIGSRANLEAAGSGEVTYYLCQSEKTDTATEALAKGELEELMWVRIYDIPKFMPDFNQAVKDYLLKYMETGSGNPV